MFFGGTSISAGLVLRSRRKETKGMKVIIAIDFGTTYSGIAYANTGEADKQTVMRNWGRGTPSDDKVPTILRYDNGGTTGPFKWGFQARKQLRKGRKMHEWFKLGLCPEHEERRAAESELSRKYPSTTALAPVTGDKDEKLVVDYLSRLKRRVDEHFGEFDVRVYELPRKYIVIVPAIWDHWEQDRTRNYAQRAGIGKGSWLQIISEPETAATFALDRMPRLGLRAGNTFVICDAGGGTVDLTSYTIRSLDPISLAGAGKRSGGLRGSSFLNRIFANCLQHKLRDYYGGWDQGFLDYAVDEFERRIKTEFTGDGDNGTYTIMVHGLADSHRHRIIGCSLELSVKELRENVFKEAIAKIQGLVRNQIATTNSAIVRGALIAGLTRHSKDQDGVFRVRGPRVESRIAGRSYGTCAYQRFNPKEDDASRKQRLSTGEDLIERMQWFVNEGHSIQDRVLKPFEFEKEQEVIMGPIQEVVIHIYSSETRDAGGIVEPKYSDDPGLRECAQLKMDLRDLELPIEKYNGIDFASFEYDHSNPLLTLMNGSPRNLDVAGKERARTHIEPQFSYMKATTQDWVFRFDNAPQQLTGGKG
ncbi:hypothetical protein BGW36DRAFT_433204 [Talaromyces proteolyticus]|uniref:Hsp70 family protein n=1 Tax=Talaromyces proteolyticus TaxID=1131652 RepID=A0AAD4PUM2_9EURO|nr:uncharacterized protein BGW36DRAFT_433204 [Talaromyces proteolyticus]KAH8690252.1 hypothetical protein BGW36DRAFT_433204 [Talaromyces proteolyticus]